MLCPRLIVITAATAIMLAAGQAHAQSTDDLRPTIWDAEDEIAGGDAGDLRIRRRDRADPAARHRSARERRSKSLRPSRLPPLPPRRIAEDDPYAPLGWRIGNLKAFFALETGANFTDNVQQSETDRKSDIGLLLAPKFNIESDWSRHKFTAQGNGEFVRYRDESDYDTQEGRSARRSSSRGPAEQRPLDLAGILHPHPGYGVGDRRSGRCDRHAR